ncbi:MAG: hypothetical protein JEY99_05495 [Spirochaetales bacterium]|nr:hypothetical protein [Spirochaetales bacterium]
MGQYRDIKESRKEVSETSMNRITTMIIIITLLMGGGILTPVLAYFGFMDDIYIPLSIGIILSILTGILIGIIASRTFFSPLKNYPVNIGTGIIYSSATYWATLGYISFRSSFYKIETIIPLAIGLLPLLLIFYIKAKISRKKGVDKRLKIEP